MCGLGEQGTRTPGPQACREEGESGRLEAGLLFPACPREPCSWSTPEAEAGNLQTGRGGLLGLFASKAGPGATSPAGCGSQLEAALAFVTGG